MTESEAIKEIETSIELAKMCTQNFERTKEIEAYAMAINALEKQIPKKPHKNFEKFSGVWCSCGKYLGKGYFIDKPSYCTDCGQKLDWSDEE